MIIRKHLKYRSAFMTRLMNAIHGDRILARIMRLVFRPYELPRKLPTMLVAQNMITERPKSGLRP